MKLRQLTPLLLVGTISAHEDRRVVGARRLGGQGDQVGAVVGVGGVQVLGVRRVRLVRVVEPGRSPTPWPPATCPAMPATLSGWPGCTFSNRSAWRMPSVTKIDVRAAVPADSEVGDDLAAGVGQADHGHRRWLPAQRGAGHVGEVAWPWRRSSSSTSRGVLLPRSVVASCLAKSAAVLVVGGDDRRRAAAGLGDDLARGPWPARASDGMVRKK